MKKEIELGYKSRLLSDLGLFSKVFKDVGDESI